MQSYPVSAELNGKTVAACLRHWLTGQTWTQVRKLIDARRIKINGEVWLDDARRLKTDDTVEVFASRCGAPTQFIDQIPKSRDKRSERKILEFIFSNLLLPDENFISDIEEKFIHWDDDAEMIIALMGGFLQKPSSFNFEEMVSKEKMDFAIDLLECVIDKKNYCLELIKPKLKNWDAERIASLDMILMQMGVCEFIYFETIPPKVTINECIDLAKEYSTEQSGHFVNGILDNIHKELLAQDKIHKKNFKNSTL